MFVFDKYLQQRHHTKKGTGRCHHRGYNEDKIKDGEPLGNKIGRKAKRGQITKRL